ncbi:TPA: phage tail protein [Salmonella enterica subsp. enterica serovar Infantis]
MTTKYFAILTNQGAARLANATMLGTKLNITQMAVGDGNGTLPTPDPAQTKLINQTRIAPINSLSVDANDAGQIIAEQIIPENEGGFFIREIGLYDDDGILIAVANCPETYKPLLAEGSGRTQTIRMILVVSSTSAITLKIDPSVVLATRKYVDDAVIEVKSYADGLMRNHEQSRNHPDATTTAKGFTQLNSSVTDDRETQSATPKAVKIAMDNANARLAKERNLADLPNPALARQNLQLGDSSTKNTGTTANTVAAGDDARITGAMQKSQNGADIPDVAKFLQNLHLEETVKQAAGAIQKSGGNMEGPLGLTRTSSFGVATENTLGGNSIAIGDSDSGFKSNGDGNIALMANGVLAGFFSENELQHRKKMLTKIFQVIAENNWTEGAGGFGSQLGSGAPFISPRITRPNDDNNYFPFWKQIVSLVSGYPVAASMGLMTTGKTNFPQIVIHAKTDFDVNDKLWVFDVASGEFRSPGRLLGTEIFLSGKTRIAADGNINSDVWGGWLSDYLNNTYNKKNTATLGFSGWSRDESTGLIMQWGNVNNANGTYSFPRAFSDTCFAVFATNKDGQGGAIDNAYGYPVSKTQFRLACKANSGADTAYGISWFALGY